MKILSRIFAFIKSLFPAKTIKELPPAPNPYDGTDHFVAIYSGMTSSNMIFIRGKKFSDYESARKCAIVSMGLDDESMCFILPDQKNQLIESLGLEHYKTALRAILNS